MNSPTQLNITNPYPNNYTRNQGYKSYELNDYSGNVLQTISDRKLPVNSAVNTTVSYFTADVASATDYYPFGQVMPGRNFNSTNYRFGYNGKEHDDELKGADNSYDYGKRMYDPRLGRWNKPDNLALFYTSYIPYAFALNNPIANSDADGDFTIRDLPEPDQTRMRAIISAAKTAYSTNPFLLSKLEEYSGLSEKQLDDIFTEGQGPVLKFANFNGDKRKNYRGDDSKDDLGLTTSPSYAGARTESGFYTIELTDEFLSGNNFPLTDEASSFYMIVTLLHEVVHVGNVTNVKGFIVKVEPKMYLPTWGDRGYLAVQYFLKEQSYTNQDTIHLTPSYYKSFNVKEMISCINGIIGKSIILNRFYFELYAGVGVRLKYGTTNLLPNEVQNDYYLSNDHEIGRFIMPNFTAGFKVGYSIIQ